MRATLSLIFIFTFFSLYTQNIEDSLLAIIRKTNSDTVKIDKYYKLASMFSHSDPSKSLQYSANGLGLAEKINYEKAKASLYNQQGLAYRSKSNYEKSLASLLKAAEINLKFKESSVLSLASNYGNIGGVYQKRGELTANKNFSKKAIEYYGMAKQMFQKLGNKNGIAGCHLEMGVILHDLKNDSAAMVEYEAALAIVKDLKFEEGVRIITNNMANSLRALKQYDKAEVLFKKNLIHDIESKDTSAIIGTYNNLASFSNEMKKWNQAIDYAMKGLELASIHKTPTDIHMSAGCLANAYEKIKNYERAVEYYKLKEQYKDTMVNASSNQQMQELESRFQNEKKELEIVNLNKEKLLQQSEIKNQQAESERQSLQKMAFAVGFALMLILAVIVLRSYNQKKRDNKIITHQKELVEEKQKEILDSIRYAKRIQQSLLPSEKYIEKKLKKKA